MRMHFLLLFLMVHLTVIGKQINIGFISEETTTYIDKSVSFDENLQKKKLRKLALSLVIEELKKNSPNVLFQVKDYFLSINRSSDFPNNVEKAIKDDNIHFFLGPFNSENIKYPQVKKTIENKNIAFVSLPNLHSLRKLNNYYTPLEWSDVGLKLAFDEIKKSFKERYPLKIAAFILNSDLSKDSYEIIEKIVPSVFAKYVFQIPGFLSYTNNLDEKIKEVLAYKPDIILNANFNEVSLDIVERAMQNGFQGFFLDSNTWGCSQIIQNYFKSKLENLKITSIGYSFDQIVCPDDAWNDEKDFRIKILQKEAYYYSEIGLLYKALKHILTKVTQSTLLVSRENIHKIIQNNSYFKGFSGTQFNLFKRKDSPEFLNFYKFFFQKEFAIRKVSGPIDTKRNKKKEL